MLEIYPFIVETLKHADGAHSTDRQARSRSRQAASAGGQQHRAEHAEAIGSQGGNERARFRTALGSNQEVRACLDVAEAWGYVDAIDPALRDRFDRIAATLYRLATGERAGRAPGRSLSRGRQRWRLQSPTLASLGRGATRRLAT